jgi:hypothetical protein
MVRAERTSWSMRNNVAFASSLGVLVEPPLIIVWSNVAVKQGGS